MDKASQIDFKKKQCNSRKRSFHKKWEKLVSKNSTESLKIYQDNVIELLLLVFVVFVRCGLENQIQSMENRNHTKTRSRKMMIHIHHLCYQSQNVPSIQYLVKKNIPMQMFPLKRKKKAHSSIQLVSIIFLISFVRNIHIYITNFFLLSLSF